VALVELADILRFFALGGELGGASAAVAFFFPRGITGKQELDEEVVLPILKDVYQGWRSRLAKRGWLVLVIIYSIVQHGFQGLTGVAPQRHTCAAVECHSHSGGKIMSMISLDEC
jgi:hypothetical protein